MAQGSHGMGGRLSMNHPGLNGLASNQPPPSTLAAQLVDNISTPAARSSHPDETAELKRLFSVIERIKDQPDLLKTDQERIEHNHLLIYVYTRVALDGLQWDNPFAKTATQVAEASKALNFLQVTISETPAVLQYKAEAKSFLFRDQEPLWLWLLPRILRMLGSEHCHSLTPVIERFCELIFDVVSRNSSVWDLGPQILLYFQTIFTAVIAQLKDAHIPDEEQGDETEGFELTLAPSPTLQQAIGQLSLVSQQRCSYTLSSLQHAVNHVTSLLHIAKNAIVPDAHAGESSPPKSAFEHLVIWLLDCLETLNQVFIRYKIAADVPVLAVVETCLDIMKGGELSQTVKGISEIVSQQVYSVMVISCSWAFGMSRELLAAAEQSSITLYTLCLALLQVGQAVVMHKPTARLVKSLLLPPLKTFTSDYHILGHGTDLWRLSLVLETLVTDPDPEAFPETVQSDAYTDPRVARQLVHLHPKLAGEKVSERPTKRLRASVGSKSLPDLLEMLDDMVPGRLFSVDAAFDESKVLDAFSRLDVDSRCLLIEIVSRLCCAADDTLTITRLPKKSTPKLCCSFCTNEDKNKDRQLECLEPKIKTLASSMFTTLIWSPDFMDSKRARVIGMIALRRVLRHVSDPELWDLQRPGGPGQWCTQSLQSSLRELRLAAGRALAVFLGGQSSTVIDEAILERNRVYVVGVLKLISDKNIPHLHESCIAAWGQVGRVAPDEELNLVLLQLLEYLGHRNMIVSASAFNEILALADARQMRAADLFAPFWRTLSFTAIKDLVSKPQTSRMVAELLQKGVPEFLLLVQSYVMPWLVLTKKREIIHKVAEARGDKEEWMVCIDGSNLGPILALLLVQDVPNLEEYCMSLFRHVSAHFDHVTLVELLGSEPVGTALELFMASGDADESRKPRIKAALSLMASLLLNDGGNRRKTHHLGRFFQQHALGLTSRFSGVITDSLQQRPPVQEQRRLIKGMEEMIRICKAYVRIARPQISACLLSALGNDELRSSAFSCWHVLLTYMEEEDVEVLLETTFFIIDHFWRSFEEASRQECVALLNGLIDSYPELMARSINKLPSLSHIEGLASVNKALNSMRTPLNSRQMFAVFARRLDHENAGVVLQTLRELAGYLKKNQAYLQASALSDQPDSLVFTISRALLDCSAKYHGSHTEVARVCAECIGLVGCLDSNRIEAPREQRHFVVMDNFDSPGETTDFVVYLLENVLVKEFLSATDTRYIGYLSYTMQGLLERVDFKVAYAQQGAGQSLDLFRKWLAMSDASKEVLTPFLTSKYTLTPMVYPPVEYPIFRPTKGYANWIRAFAVDLLNNGQNLFAQLIFEPLCRVIRVKDTAVAEFLLPYLVVHVVIGDEDKSGSLKQKVVNELLAILMYEPKEDASHLEKEDIKHCYEAVFHVLDYAMRWLQTTKAKYGDTGVHARRYAQMQALLDAIHPELISQRAVYCRQYSLALFHLEPYYRREGSERRLNPDEQQGLLQSIQDIYAQIDDPDGLEGMIATVANVDIDQMILSHRKAGRWEATQTWYEIRLAEDPDNLDVQLDLLTCLKESGQHDVLLNYVEGMSNNMATNKIAPFAVEASWATGRWETLRKYLGMFTHNEVTEEFDLGIAQALLYLKDGHVNSFRGYLQTLRDKAASELSHSSTASFRACHAARLKCHVLSDLEMIATQRDGSDTRPILTSLQRRLEILGAYVTDKQYVLGVRRAAMELVQPTFANTDVASLWLSSARLARKAGSIHQSFNAVLHADQLGDGFAKIENARLLWKDGHHRKAIQLLHCAIDNNSFINEAASMAAPTSSRNPTTEKALLTAKAHLLLAKWQDSAGQTHASAQRLQYQQAAKTYPQWEKGHYYLGRHYKKILESERGLKFGDQSDAYLTGETAKLVIENYLRSLNFGTKYLYQTLPSVLTIWLEMGSQVKETPAPKMAALSKELLERRLKHLNEVHDYISKNLQRLPTYIFYTALPQIVARIAHPNEKVFAILQDIIVKVVEAHPRQALWNMFSFMTTKQASERRTRGQKILQRLRGISRKVDDGTYDLRQLLRMGEKLATQLLDACNNGEFASNRTVQASIVRDLGFDHRCTPCPLVVPIEACLAATLPTLTDNIKRHKAFSRDVITIDSFLDDVLVLGSLAKPRKLTARGSDGKTYGLLIKPKDDLRTDQRLMEFNSMINRSLKRDAESSRRQLYIRTYAVTPLNEECGIIEWVDGLKTIRDILLNLYKQRGISPNYQNIAQLMKNACADAPKYQHLNLFTETVLGMFPPVLPEWFISQFPNPEAWFAARLRYTRSCAVMSMVGTILGLGDRHGENLLLEEGNGGIFHVDFNCLFDKGLTFAQPERVPFRLTHNMVAAMGIYGVEGPFRQCSELTLKILRAQEETLMTILEAFIYDPTLDLQRNKRRKDEVVKLNPTSVVESIKRKVKGLLPDESIPLGVEGQVEELIKQAVDPRNLTAMYIGWCPFL